MVLRFLDENPDLRDNPVYIVGESYGGVRATVMLHLMLNYRDYGDGSEVYRDNQLVNEIQAHLEKVFPDYVGREVPKELIASQFSHQMLIESLLTGYQFDLAGEMFEQPGSIIFQIAQDTGTTYIPCDGSDPDCDPFSNALNYICEVAMRDVYQYKMPANWLVDRFLEADRKFVNSVDLLSTLLGVRPETMNFLPASQRQRAYRFVSVDDIETQQVDRDPRHLVEITTPRPVVPDGTLEQDLGELAPWDAYWVFCSNEVEDAYYDKVATAAGFDIDPLAYRFGRLFLENLRDLKTFITGAQDDLIIFSSVTRDALSRYPEVTNQVTIDPLPADAARPGTLTVSYSDGDVREIRFPPYANAAHSVAVTNPAELLEDVRAWLR